MDWFNCYLSKRKQFTGYNVNSKSTLLDIVCWMPRESIFGSLLFLLYITDLPQASKVLDHIMFTDDTNLFYSGKDIHSLFNTVNHELSNISYWFVSNKLTLNADKAKLTLFHKARQRDNIPIVLPTLKNKQHPYKASRPYQVFRVFIWWKSDKKFTRRKNSIEQKIH